MEEQARQQALPQAEEARQEALRAAEEARRREGQAREIEEQRRREQLEREQRRLVAARGDREPSQAQRQAYITGLQATVERRWRRPEGARSTDEAVVLVRINPETGQILGYDLQRCSGGEAFCDSVRQITDRLQTLPRPPDAAAVRGGIRIRFSP